MLHDSSPISPQQISSGIWALESQTNGIEIVGLTADLYQCYVITDMTGIL